MARHCPKTPKVVVELQKICIALIFVGTDSEEPNSTFDVVQGGFRVDSNPTLCGLLNGDVDTFVVLNFKNNLCLTVYSY
jgi:hypothetical protein